MGIIYMAVNTVNNKAYIGKTIRTLAARRIEHYKPSSANRNKAYFRKAIQKYGRDAFEWDILETVDNDKLDAAEMFYIALFRRNGIELYNLTAGGGGPTNRVVSAETRAKISEKAKGHKRWLGRKHTEESKMKMRESQIGRFKGRTLSEKDRRKKSRGHTNNRCITLIDKNGYLYHNIDNLRQFALEHNIIHSGISQLILGRAKSYKGFRLHSIYKCDTL